ncbi:MAG: hypothetical protein LQ351_001733 [Letrouitia transgressa]|nr:MAG: hypothetical protein LQ351_001733 [Letrouitia transgressa]
MLPRLDQITEDQIQQILDSHQSDSLTLFHLNGGEGFWAGGDFTAYEANKRNVVLDRFCKDLLNAALNVETHVSQIDQILSRLIDVYFYYPTLRKDIIPYTRNVLQRLPVYSILLPGKLPGWLNSAYFQEDVCGVWEDLLINNTSSLNIVRVAIYTSIHEMHLDPIHKLLTLLGELLTLASQQTSGPEQQGWFIVRTALWISWQRISMLYFFALVGAEGRLDNKWGFSQENRLALRDFQPVAGQGIQYRFDYLDGVKADYMCSWAYEHLKLQPSCIGMDLRRLIQRFNSTWGQRSGRCRTGSSSSCVGRINLLITKTAMGIAQNLCGMKAHIEEFEAQELYASLKLPPKVAFNTALSQPIPLQSRMSGLTVKEAGQRMELIDVSMRGMRKLLAAMAVILIGGIRLAFPKIINYAARRFKVSTELLNKETILATVLLSDWNTRAWTYLESMRGRNNLYLLCKNSYCIKFLDLIQDIWSEGCIDIAILSLTVRHMLPAGAIGENAYLEPAGNMLSHRPASRKGDDLVIWSLLIGLDKSGTAQLPFGETDQNSEEFCFRFWQTFIGEWISPGFLMSSAPRLKTPGFTWAPRTATCLPEGADTWLKQAHFNGPPTRNVKITNQGIMGEWVWYPFQTKEFLSLALSPYTSGIANRLKQICEEHLRGYSEGALIHPITEDMEAFIDPETEELDYGRGNVDFIGYQSRSGGTLVTILGRNEMSSCQPLGWKWLCIYFWSDSTDYMPLRVIKDLLIS